MAPPTAHFFAFFRISIMISFWDCSVGDDGPAQRRHVEPRQLDLDLARRGHEPAVSRRQGRLLQLPAAQSRGRSGNRTEMGQCGNKTKANRSALPAEENSVEPDWSLVVVVVLFVYFFYRPFLFDRLSMGVSIKRMQRNETDIGVMLAKLGSH